MKRTERIPCWWISPLVLALVGMAASTRPANAQAGRFGTPAAFRGVESVRIQVILGWDPTTPGQTRDDFRRSLRQPFEQAARDLGLVVDSEAPNAVTCSVNTAASPGGMVAVGRGLDLRVPVVRNGQPVHAVAWATTGISVLPPAEVDGGEAGAWCARELERAWREAHG